VLPEKVVPEKNVCTGSLEDLRNYLDSDFRVTYAATDLSSIELDTEGMVRSVKQSRRCARTRPGNVC
jgi:hypothetical protein